MNETQIKNIVEAALLASGRPLSLDQLLALFVEADRPERKTIRDVIALIQADYTDRGIELDEVASGYRIQVQANYGEWISRLWQERPPRYSRALMETMALIAYRQPITRGEIEDIRGVSVSSNIMRTLLERGWARVVGHRDVPGKPAMFGTTKGFLDYFGLKSLDELPTLGEIQDLDSLNVELDLQGPALLDSEDTSAAQNDNPDAAELVAGADSPTVDTETLQVIRGDQTKPALSPDSPPDAVHADPDALGESGDKSIA
jgi:segregation and condensation protein B